VRVNRHIFACGIRIRDRARCRSLISGEGWALAFVSAGPAKAPLTGTVAHYVVVDVFLPAGFRADRDLAWSRSDTEAPRGIRMSDPSHIDATVLAAGNGTRPLLRTNPIAKPRPSPQRRRPHAGARDLSEISHRSGRMLLLHRQDLTDDVGKRTGPRSVVGVGARIGPRSVISDAVIRGGPAPTPDRSPEFASASMSEGASSRGPGSSWRHKRQAAMSQGNNDGME